MSDAVNLDELSGADLRAHAAELGLKTDKRWGDERVREELRALLASQGDTPTDPTDPTPDVDVSSQESVGVSGRPSRPPPRPRLVLRSTTRGPFELHVPGHPPVCVPAKGELVVSAELLEALGKHKPTRVYFDAGLIEVVES